MTYLTLGTSGIPSSRLALGCMRINTLAPADVAALLGTARDEGIDLFDHADIYGAGRSEEVFAAAVRQLGLPRSSIILQSKCGIRKDQYDLSREHILASVRAILKRLGTDYLDLMLLHRPDALVEPDEVAAAFLELHRSGAVRSFGVSNFNPAQIELLATAVPLPLVVNQLQLSLMHTPVIDAGLNVNLKNEGSVDHDGAVLDYCRTKGITVQAWSPFLFGFFEGVFIGHPKFPVVNGVLDRMAEERGVTSSAIALAWLLRHPARMQPIVGTTNPQRLGELCRATGIELTRAEWYELYLAAGNTLP